VYRCIALRAASVASLSYMVDKTPAGIPYRALYLCETSLCTHGALYIERATRRVLNPAAMSVVADAVRGITGYRFRSAQYARDYTPDQIAYATLWSPDSDVGPGLSPLRVAQESAQTALSAERFTAAFFAQGALPPIVIHPTEGMLTEADAEAIRTTWQRLLAGVRNAWRALVLRRNLDVKTLDLPALDRLAMSDVDDISLRRIAAAFGVPVTMITDAANYATAKEHRVSYWRETIIPQAEMIAEAWSVVLGREVTINYDDIEALAEDEQMKRESVIKMYEAGLIERNEAREMLGMSAIAPEPQAISSVMLDELGAWARKSAARDVRCADWTPDALTPAIVQSVRALSEVRAQPFAWTQYVGAIKARQQPPLNKASKQLGIAIAAIMEQYITDNGAFDDKKFERDLLNTVPQSLLNVAVDAAVAQMITANGWANVEAAYDFAARWADTYGFELVTEITENSAKKIREALEAAKRNDWPRETLVERLKKVFGAQRAEMIATTEITRAYSEGTEIARQILADAGVQRVHVWRTAADELVCDICGPRNGRRQGDGWDQLPPAHVNCRCWTTLEKVGR
jgi:HK97 family phage portal protein